MPRDGSHHYSIPVGTDGVPDQTIDSGRYNAFVHDVETDLNTPRPISAGGTGANNAADAISNLNGELTRQVVTNYDIFPFVSGSFSSAAGTTSEPVAGHGFAGICYVDDLDSRFLTLEARDMQDSVVPGRLYVRQKLAGVWGPWVNEDQDVVDLANSKVARAGDTMSGNLSIVRSDPSLILDADPGHTAQVLARKGGVNRWSLYLGDGTAETGANAGSNFFINSFNDAGSTLGTALAINRSDGRLFSNGYVPATAGELTNKAYVDAQINAKVSKSGDTMSGPLTIDNAILVRSTPNDCGVFITPSAGAYGSIYGVNAANNVAKNLIINEFGGNVGIGTHSPGAKLHVLSPDGTGVLFTGATNGIRFLFDSAGSKVEGVDSSGIASYQPLSFNGSSLYLNTNGGARLILTDSAAAFGVPVTAPTVNATAASAGYSRFNSSDGNPAIILQNNGVDKSQWTLSAGTTCFDFQGTLLFRNGIGGPNTLVVDSSGTIKTGNGMTGKAGISGGYDANVHNFYWTGTAGQMWIDNSNFGNIQTVCDYRVKKDVVPLASTWGVVKALNPIVYTHAGFTPPSAIAAAEARGEEAAPLFVDDDEPYWGFLAHELQETLLPSAAHGYKDSPDDIQTPNVLCVVAALARCLQEAMARIEALEQRR